MAEEVLFAELLPPVRRPWFGCAISLVLHTLFLSVLPLLEYEEPVWKPRRSVILVSPLSIRVPDRAYFARSVPSKVTGKARHPNPSPALPPGPELARAGPHTMQWASPPARDIQLPAPPQRAQPRRFEFPPPPTMQKAAQTVLLPEARLTLDPMQSPPVPAMMVWGQPVVPRPEPRRYVSPGSKVVPAEPPLLDAPPSLAAPNLEVTPAALPIANWTTQSASLPRPAGGARPLRIYSPSQRTAGGELNTELIGTPINLISLPSRSAKWSEKIDIPRILQLAHQVAGQGSAFSGHGSAASPRNGPKGGNGPKGDGEGGSPSEPETGVPTGHDAAANSATSQNVIIAASLIRTVHPNNAVYDVVIQSSAEDVLPEGSGVLSGRPVYTVYLPVGPRRNWILQYCLPEGSQANSDATQQVIRLDNPPPLKAPYPLVSFIPPKAPPAESKYLLIHGVITRDGSFASLRLVKATEPTLGNALLNALAQWEFRPASRDGVAVAVEVLLAIPTERS